MKRFVIALFLATCVLGAFAAATNQSVLLDNNGRPIPQLYDQSADTYRALTGPLDTAALVTHSSASAGANSADQVNANFHGIVVMVNISAITGTSPTLTVTLQGKDPVSGQYHNIIATAALTTTGFTTLKVYPGLAVTANATANDILPRTWRVSTAIGGTGPSVSATVSASLIP